MRSCGNQCLGLVTDLEGVWNACDLPPSWYFQEMNRHASFMGHLNKWSSN